MEGQVRMIGGAGGAILAERRDVVLDGQLCIFPCSARYTPDRARRRGEALRGATHR